MDLIIRNGDVATASAVYRADIGIAGGKIVRIERGLAGAVASEGGMAPNAKINRNDRSLLTISKNSIPKS